MSSIDKMACVRAWFAEHSVDLDALVERTRDLVGAQCVVLTGSIAAGRGNHLSDIDLFVLGDTVEARLQEIGQFDYGLTIEANYRLPNNFEVETYTVPAEHIAQIGQRIEIAVQMFANPADVKGNIPVLDPATYRLLDDIRTGMCLYGPDRFERFKADFHMDFIPSFVLMVSIVDHLVAREDIVGHLERGRADTAAMLVRDAAEYLGRAILAGLGEANTRPQWRLHLLDQARSQVGDETIDRLRGYLLRPPHDETTIRADFEAFCAFADSQIAGIMSRAPQLVPTFATMSQKVQFRASL